MIPSFSFLVLFTSERGLYSPFLFGGITEGLPFVDWVPSVDLTWLTYVLLFYVCFIFFFSLLLLSRKRMVAMLLLVLSGEKDE